MGDVLFREIFSARQCGEDLVDSWKWVGVYNRNRVQGEFIVPTNLNTPILWNAICFKKNTPILGDK